MRKTGEPPKNKLLGLGLVGRVFAGLMASACGMGRAVLGRSKEVALWLPGWGSRSGLLHVTLAPQVLE